jgi:hypothetical protein
VVKLTGILAVFEVKLLGILRKMVKFEWLVKNNWKPTVQITRFLIGWRFFLYKVTPVTD